MSRTRKTQVPPTEPTVFSPKRTRKQRLLEWYRSRSSRAKFFLWGIVVVLVLLLVQLLVQGYLSLHAIRNNDLVLYVNADGEKIKLAHGAQSTLAFSYAASLLPLCEAQCAWTITDLGAQETVASGNFVAHDGTSGVAQATVHAKPGQVLTPYQFTLTCDRTSASYCKSSNPTSVAASLSVVESVYTDAEFAALTAIEQSLQPWDDRMRQTAGQLAGIVALTDPRVASVSTSAREELIFIQQQYGTIATAQHTFAVLDMAFALSAYPATTAIASYESLVAEEQALRDRFTAVQSKQATYDALFAIASSPDRALLRTKLAAVNTVGTEFATVPFSAVTAALDELAFTTRALEQSYTTDTVARATAGAAALFAEKQMACALKAGPCPEQPEPVTTLAQATASLAAICAELGNNTTFMSYEDALTTQVDPNSTRAALEATYAVATVRARPDFVQWSASVQSAARVGSPVLLNTSERLAVPLAWSSESLAFVAANCSFVSERANIPAVPVATLPIAPTAQVSLPVLAVPHSECCGVGSCGVCQAQRVPVVFVHGHSFAQATSPDSSVSAFAPIALSLQQDGSGLYAGSVFPVEQLAPLTQGEFHAIPERLFFTTTYYYDSYAEDGDISFVAEKSQNIETYAIRLKEAIAVAKHKSGQEKVILVAHSMGGLVARRYLQLFGEDSVSALVMIGTPNHGINGTTLRACPLFGSSKECTDMAQGSVFLTKLNAGEQPRIPVYVIAGTGCENRGYDGVVETDNVLLDWANNTVVQGSCSGTSDLLHLSLIDPHRHPEVTSFLRALLAHAD